jgi:hypothetical protein
MAKPKFYLEPRSDANGDQESEQAINMFYSIGGGKRLQYYTGVRIDTKYFRPECNKSNSIIKPIKSTAPYAIQYNNRLSDIASSAVTIASEAKGDNHTIQYLREQLDLIFKPKKESVAEIKHDFVSFFKKIIADSKSGTRLIPKGNNKGNRYSYNSIKNYGIALASVNRFMVYKGLNILPLESVNIAFYEDFRYFCYTVEQKEKSTFACYVKDIKTVMTESKTAGFEPKEFVMPSYEADTLYLNADQINKVSILDLSDKNQSYKLKRGQEIENISYQALDKVRDLFLIGCFTGLRFSDFNALELTNISGNFINIKQVKTKARVTIPIMSKLRPVLNKYPDSLPTISNQKFNDYIKCVADLAGLNELITVKNTKGNIQNQTITPLHALVTSHCCRRSYATNMFKAGVPPMLIMSATGHKTETSFLKYIRATNDDKAKLLSEALQKLGL